MICDDFSVLRYFSDYIIDDLTIRVSQNLYVSLLIHHTNNNLTYIAVDYCTLSRSVLLLRGGHCVGDCTNK